MPIKKPPVLTRAQIRNVVDGVRRSKYTSVPKVRERRTRILEKLLRGPPKRGKLVEIGKQLGVKTVIVWNDVRSMIAVLESKESLSPQERAVWDVLNSTKKQPSLQLENPRLKKIRAFRENLKRLSKLSGTAKANDSNKKLVSERIRSWEDSLSKAEHAMADKSVQRGRDRIQIKPALIKKLVDSARRHIIESYMLRVERTEFELVKLFSQGKTRSDEEVRAHLNNLKELKEYLRVMQNPMKIMKRDKNRTAATEKTSSANQVRTNRAERRKRNEFIISELLNGKTHEELAAEVGLAVDYLKNRFSKKKIQQIKSDREKIK